MFFILHCPCYNCPPAPTEPLCQPIIHLMLMTRCQPYCPTDIMSEDWCIDRMRLIRAEMIQQHCMIYSAFNILRQNCPRGFVSLRPVYFDHLCQYQTPFTDHSSSSCICTRQWHSPLSGDCLNKSQRRLQTDAFCIYWVANRGVFFLSVSHFT